MSVIITTNEPMMIKKLFLDRVETPMNFDMLLYTRKGKLPIERKKAPGDLLASVTDGRLGREIQAMRQESQFYVVLLHGVIRYHRDGTVVMYGNKGRGWTKKGVRNLLRSLQLVEGCFIEQADNDRELVKVVDELQTYFDNWDKHLSLKTRPNLQTNWLIPNRMEKVIYFYSGLPGISAIRAKALAERFVSPLDLYKASIEDIMSLSGIGKGIANAIYTFLREG